MQYDHTNQQKTAFVVINPHGTGNDSYSPNLKGFDEHAYLSAKTLVGNEDPYKRNKFNQAVSDTIPINRAISDTRSFRWVMGDCRQQLVGGSAVSGGLVGGPAGSGGLGGWSCREWWAWWVALQ